MANKGETREYCGRKFSEEDMALIKEITETYPNLSQKELAGTTCELIGWVQTNGKPKIDQCVRFLRNLAEEGALALPEIKVGKARAGALPSKTQGARKEGHR